jgi:putative nucleotidyltransferase with HDIG domain
MCIRDRYIGKTKRPEFFIENKTGDNPHDRLTPALSAKIISAHVKDGLKLAEEHRLPPTIRDGIAEHHGTSLISYFYYLHKETNREKERSTAVIAKEISTNDPLMEQHFRYPGPRPKTKETAVLLLADRVEAITRTRPPGSPGRVRALVWEIIQDVREDGQLDDSELNFRDLQTIVDSFVSSLGALRHERIDYPGVNLDAIEEESSSPGVEQSEEGAAHTGPEDSDSEDA